MMRSKLYQPINKLCWDGFDKFRNYCNSLHPSLSGNQSMEIVINSFEGSYNDWQLLVKGVTNGAD